MSAKRTVIEQKFKKMEAEAKRLGVILLTKPETFIDDDHLDCTWYGGYIGGFQYEGYVVSVAAMGDVRVSGEYKGVEVDYVDKNNDGAMSHNSDASLRTAFESDKELYQAVEDGDIEFGNNNWIEVFVKDPSGKSLDSFVCDDSDVLDACCDISCMLDWLKANFVEK